MAFRIPTNRVELLRVLSAKADVSQTKAAAVWDAMLALARDGVRQSGSFSFPGLGKIERVERKTAANDVIDGQHRYIFTYRGIHFSAGTDAGTCVYMIDNYNFHVTLPIDKKISILIQMYQKNPDEERLLQYLKGKDFLIEVVLLISENQTAVIREIVSAGQLIPKGAVDKMIRLAIEKKTYEIQVLLTDYKRRQFGFESIEEKAKGLLLD